MFSIKISEYVSTLCLLFDFEILKIESYEKISLAL